MPSNPPPKKTWPGDTLGSVIIEKFTNAEMYLAFFGGRAMLTWENKPAGIDPSFTLTIGPHTKYPAQRVRKFMLGAGISPEKWKEL